MLPIRQTLNALPTAALSRTSKAVLIEVCRLAELPDAQGWCTAKNDYLIGCLGGTERTMSRAFTLLEQRGLLRVQGKGKARRAAPTPALRACYASPEPAQRHAALVALGLLPADADSSESASPNLDKRGAQPRQNASANLDILDAEPSQNVQVEPGQPRQNAQTNLDKSGTQPRQNASRVYGDQEYQVKTSTPSPACACGGEREALQKKIADLENENRRLKAKIQEVVPPVAAPPRRPAVAAPEPAPYSEASKALAAEVAPVWSINRVAGGGLWMKLTRFCHVMDTGGRLDEARRQLTAYAAYLAKRRIEPYALERFLGSEGGGYVGEWCQVDWPDKAAKARADGERTPPGPPAAPNQAALNIKKQAAAQRQQTI